MRPTPSRRLALGLAAALLALPLAACEQDADPTPEPGGQVTLQFGVFGNEAVVAAYQAIVDSYNAEAQSTEVELLSWPTSAEMTAALESGEASPDVFLVARRDLAGVLDEKRNVPLFELLAERDISYGDDYARSAIQAFSADDDLQCMPSTISPMVIYYNTDLVDFDAMRARGLEAPEDELEGWTFEEFQAAAAFASRRGDDRGVSISPTVSSLAPFLLSGGGSVFDGLEPTSLDLSSSTNRDTFRTILALLRDSGVTLSEEQLAEATPQEWFERGELGMIEGFRDLGPELREVDGLNFDVMPMPEVGSPATIGDVTGLCIAPGDNVQPSADFLVHAISDASVEGLAATGYVVPANLGVARSEEFLQAGEQPAHAGVFNASVDQLQLLPLVDDPSALNEAVEPLLTEMLISPGFIDIDQLTTDIDEASRSVLDPDYSPTPSSDPTS